MSLALILLLASPAAVPEPGPIFEVSPFFDGLVGGGAMTVGVLLDRQKLEWAGVSPCEGLAREATPEERLAFDLMDPKEGLCDAATIAPIDRWVVDQGFDSAGLFSNVVITPLLLAPLFAGSLPADDKADRLGETFLVSMQTYGLIVLMTSAVKTSILRARPLTYSSDFDKEDRYAGDARLSFFSGHSALSFGAASLVTVILAKQGYESTTLLALSGGAYLGASLVAYLRIAARKHFLTDVLVGALIGTVVGLIVPLAHGLSATDAVTSGALGSVGADPGYHPLVGLGGAF